MPKIVIIGAGPTGLSTAYHLEKKGFFDYKIFEKESTTGGLCRSIQQDGFTFDFTGHLIHVNDPYFKSFLETIVGHQSLNMITRRSFIYSHDTYTRFPFQINLFGLPENVITECIEEFVLRSKNKQKEKSFHDWVLKAFGKGMGKHFFFPYQKKIFSYDLKKISSTWTGRFVPQTSLRQILKGALRDIKDDDIGYNSTFFYPKTGGISFWVDALAAQLHNPIYTNFCVKEVNTKEKYVTFTNGHVEYFDRLITTMPLDRLLTSLKEKSSTFVKRASEKLLCNKVVNFNLGINRANLSDKHWIYFPESKYPFYRMGFYHNFSNNLVPAGQSSLYGEFAHINSTPQQVTRKLNRSLKETQRILKLDSSEIATKAILPIEHAYVIYDFWREKHLPSIHKALRNYHIHSIGRYGEWKYASMQEAVLDGKKIVDQLILIPAQQATYTAGVYEEQEEHRIH